MNKERGGKMIKEFKEFAMRGNVLDLAVGIIIGAAFGKIVTSVVEDILMPLIGIISGGIDLTTLSVEVKDSVVYYGKFMQNTIDFLIVAASIFVLIKVINKLIPKPKAKITKSAELKTLEEIRDILKKKK